MVSDQSVNFPKRTIVNYEDPNVNVDMPVFRFLKMDSCQYISNVQWCAVSTGIMTTLLVMDILQAYISFYELKFSNMLAAALDLLSVSSLVNYFGQQEDLNKVLGAHLQ